MSDPKQAGDVLVELGVGRFIQAAERFMAAPENAERAERQREADDEALRAGRRHTLMLQGVPVKDIPAIVADSLGDTSPMRAVRAFLGDQRARLLVLAGPRGTGKSTAAAWVIAQPCPEPYEGPGSMRRVYRGGVDRLEREPWPFELHARFLDVSRLQRLSKFRDEDMGPVERCSMLAIDDLGMEHLDQAGNFLSVLDGLVNARYAASLRTVITTNLNASTFKGRYGERIADRLREVGRFVECAGESLRGR